MTVYTDFSSCLLHLLQVQYPGLAISSVPPSLPSLIFVVFDQCCWLLYCCWLPLRAMLSSLLLSCFTQCYCEELRAQMRWGAPEVFFSSSIIIILKPSENHQLVDQMIVSFIVYDLNEFHCPVSFLHILSSALSTFSLQNRWDDGHVVIISMLQTDAAPAMASTYL